MQQVPAAFVIHRDKGTRLRLNRVLSGMGVQVSECASAEEFLALSAKQMRRACCLILDVELPGIGGLGLQEILSRDGVGPALVFFSAVAEMSLVIQAMKSGALDFFPATVDSDNLRRRLERAIKIAIPLHADCTAVREYETRVASLATDELRFLRLLVDGQTPKEISDVMKICLATVTRRRKEMFQKMGVANIVELARKDWLSDKARSRRARLTDSGPHFVRTPMNAAIESCDSR